MSDWFRFWSKVSIDDGCWEWNGSKHPRGYGCFKFDGRTKRAHRVSWEMTNGDVPDGMHVLHRCDNPGCVNPGHLFIGSHSENMHDRDSKGRMARGERNSASKVTEESVRDIRSRYADGGITQTDLAYEYGISPSQTCRIVSGIYWGHV